LNIEDRCERHELGFLSWREDDAAALIELVRAARDIQIIEEHDAPVVDPYDKDVWSKVNRFRAAIDSVAAGEPPGKNSNATSGTGRNAG